MTQDMRGRTCMVTGATNGIGRAAAFALARRGATLVLVARSRERGEATLAALREETGAEDPLLLVADLSSQAEIRGLAETFLAEERPLHVLLNNAGVILTRREETEDGIETTFAVNHLAYFLLTNLLLPRLRASAPARIVNVASDAHAQAGGRLDFDDLESRRAYSAMRVYGRSKLANILFTRELARRLEGTGVTANAMHPGFVGSNFARNNGVLAGVAMTLLRPFARSPEKGAETAVWLCTAPELEGVSGRYFFDRAEHAPRPFARHDDDARRLWTVSEQMTGLS
ncbi:MAG: SDR family NAD(P)-dependent oxidoreductase [Myxococcota bacterium]|nr:SDR family NAD(P)-dependent oxidoreductase [Myxococcota bacterium]